MLLSDKIKSKMPARLHEKRVQGLLISDVCINGTQRTDALLLVVHRVEGSNRRPSISSLFLIKCTYTEQQLHQKMETARNGRIEKNLNIR